MYDLREVRWLFSCLVLGTVWLVAAISVAVVWIPFLRDCQADIVFRGLVDRHDHAVPFEPGWYNRKDCDNG